MEKRLQMFFIKFSHGHNLLNLWVMDPNLFFIKVLLQYLCFDTNMLQCKFNSFDHDLL